MGIPVEVYEAREDVLGEESARKPVHGIEAAVEATTTVKLAGRYGIPASPHQRVR